MPRLQWCVEHTLVTANAIVVLLHHQDRVRGPGQQQCTELCLHPDPHNFAGTLMHRTMLRLCWLCWLCWLYMLILACWRFNGLEAGSFKHGADIHGTCGIRTTDSVHATYLALMMFDSWLQKVGLRRCNCCTAAWNKRHYCGVQPTNR